MTLIVFRRRGLTLVLRTSSDIGVKKQRMSQSDSGPTSFSVLTVRDLHGKTKILTLKRLDRQTGADSYRGLGTSSYPSWKDRGGRTELP